MLMMTMMMMMMVINVKRAVMKNEAIGDKDYDKQYHDCDFEFLEIGDYCKFLDYKMMPTYPSPEPTFCPKWEVSVNVGLGVG